MRIRRLIASLAALSMSAYLLPAAEHHGQVKFNELPLPGATVTATQGDKQFGALTDEEGLYSFPNLADGNWTVRVEMLLFEPVEREVAVQPQAPEEQFELNMLAPEEIQAKAQQQAPSATPPAPQPNARPRRRSQQQVAANTSSAFQQAEVNAAAAVPSSAAAAANEASGELGGRSQGSWEGFLINGSVNNGASTPFGQAATFGNNRPRGPALYNYSIGITAANSAWNASPYSLTGQKSQKADTSMLQGSLSFGGPLRLPGLAPRDGPNLTINYEWLRNDNGSTQTTRVPTAEERSGDFSQTLNALGQPVSIIDPVTGQPFTGSAIPAESISPQAMALLRFYPLPNFNANAAYNYQIPLQNTTHQDSLQARVDKRIGPNDSLNVSFGFQSVRGDNPNVLGFLDTTRSLGWNSLVNWNHQFPRRKILNTVVRFTRFSYEMRPFFANRENVSGEAGITGNNQDPINWGPPTLRFSQGIQMLNDRESSVNHNQTGSVASSILLPHSAHNVTIGGEYQRHQFNQLSQQNSRGTFTFTGAATGNDFAGFLLGIPDASAIAFGNRDKYFRKNVYALYVADDWRVSPSLTIYPSLRWEYGTPITELYGRLVNLDVAQGYSAIAPVTASDPTGALTGEHYPSSLIRPYKKAFQPRFGLAWRPFLNSPMVVRAGYGVYYDSSSVYDPIAMNQMAQQPPFSKNLSVQNTAANPLTLANGFYAPPNVVTNTFGVDPNFRPGYAQNWRVDVQQDLPFSLVMIASYLGIKGTHLQQQFLPNTYPVGAVNPCPSCQAGYIYLTSSGNSITHKGIIQLRRRLRNGFTAQVNYTLSKSLDNAALGGEGRVVAQDWLNLRSERGRSNTDQRHLVSTAVQYTTGMGVGGGTLMGGWRGSLFKDWTYVSQLNVGTGLPLTPAFPTVLGGTGFSETVRPDYTGASLYDAPPGLYLNPAAVAAPQPGRWGNAGRNTIEGPSQFSLNASMQRTFRVNGRVSADFRIDANNILNRAVFTAWNVNYLNPQFGLPTAVGGMRTLQTTFRLRF